MSTYDTIMMISSIVGSVVGIIGNFIAVLGLFSHTDKREPRNQSPAITAASEKAAHDGSVAKSNRAPVINGGFHNAVFFIICEELRRVKIVFLGDHLTDEGVYQNFKVSIIMSISCFIFVLFSGISIINSNETIFGGVIAILLAVLSFMGAAILYLGYLRFHRRFGS